MTEFESKKILELYRIPTVRTLIAKNINEAATISKDLGFPVVLKLHSETITHKTDIGGVKLNLRSESEVRLAFTEIQTRVTTEASAKDFLGVSVQPMVPSDGYEIILGSSIDPQFGPILLFGMGGQLVEVFKDHSLGLPPLTTTLARRMIERTKIFKALKGVRGRKAVDLPALEQLLVRFSELVFNHPEISEIDINPLLVSVNGFIALDARLVLHSSDVQVLPRPAIRPYPSQYQRVFQTNNHEKISIRSIRPDDENKIRNFHRGLSAQSVYSRYLKTYELSERTTHERLTRICFIDYDREMALVALTQNSGDESIVAVARLKKNLARTRGELSVIVVDSRQRQGLGFELIQRLIRIAQEESLRGVWASLSSENRAMRSIFEKLGFSIHSQEQGLIAILDFQNISQGSSPLPK